MHARAVTNSPPIDGQDGCSRLTLVRRAELVIILPLRDTLSIAEIIVGHFVPGLDSQLLPRGQKSAHKPRQATSHPSQPLPQRSAGMGQPGQVGRRIGAWLMTGGGWGSTRLWIGVCDSGFGGSVTWL